MFSIASSHWMFLLVATVFKKKKKSTGRSSPFGLLLLITWTSYLIEKTLSMGSFK